MSQLTAQSKGKQWIVILKSNYYIESRVGKHFLFILWYLNKQQINSYNYKKIIFDNYIFYFIFVCCIFFLENGNKFEWLSIRRPWGLFQVKSYNSKSLQQKLDQPSAGTLTVLKKIRNVTIQISKSLVHRLEGGQVTIFHQVKNTFFLLNFINIIFTHWTQIKMSKWKVSRIDCNKNIVNTHTHTIKNPGGGGGDAQIFSKIPERSSV